MTGSDEPVDECHVKEEALNSGELPTLMSQTLSRGAPIVAKTASEDFGTQVETHGYISSVLPTKQVPWIQPSVAAELRASTLSSLQLASGGLDDP